MAREEQRITNVSTGFSGAYTRIAQKLTIDRRWVKSLSFPLRNTGSPTGNIYFRIRATDDDAILVGGTLCDAGDLSTEVAWYEVIFSSPTYINDEVYLAVEWYGWADLTGVAVYYADPGVKSNEAAYYYDDDTDTWSAFSGDKDLAYSYDYYTTRRVAASADDAWVIPPDTSINITAPFERAGYAAFSYPQNGGVMRFRDIPIPKAATVTGAKLILTAYETNSNTTVNSRIRCEKSANPAPFSDWADYNARTWTTEYINWDNIAAWTEDTVYESADFTAALQEVIDMDAWEPGNAVVVLWDDFEERSTASTNTDREAYSYNGDSDKAPRLYVTFSTADPCYEFYVDWGDDTLNLTYANITSDILKASWEIGKNSELGHADAGTCELILRNDDLRYAPWYSSSPLYGYVKPGKIITIKGFHDGFGCALFRGRINRIQPRPFKNEQQVYIYAVDDMDILARTKVSLETLVDKDTGTLVGEILDEVGWDSDMRDIATGSVIVRYFNIEDEPALTKIQQLETLENGFFYVDRRGYAIFESRLFRYKFPQVQTKATITNPRRIGYDLPITTVINRARATYSIYRTIPSCALRQSYDEDSEELRPHKNLYVKRCELTRSAGSYDLGPYTFKVEGAFASGQWQFGYYSARRWYHEDWERWILDWDFNTADTSSISLKGDKLTVTLSSIPSSDYDSWTEPGVMYFEGCPLEAKGDQEMEVEDTDSQTDYGIRDYDLNFPLAASEQQVKSHLNTLIGRYPDPVIDGMPVEMINLNDATWDQILERHVSDKIRLTLSDVSLDDYYYINKESHTLLPKYKHEVTWYLGERLIVDTTYWILGLSEMGVGTKLAP